LGRWETTDSSVVVISVNKVDSDVRTEIPATPYEILFSSIDHVTKREVARGRSFLLLFGPMLLIPVIIYFAGSAAGRV